MLGCLSLCLNLYRSFDSVAKGNWLPFLIATEKLPLFYEQPFTQIAAPIERKAFIARFPQHLPHNTLNCVTFIQPGVTYSSVRYGHLLIELVIQ
jgi:hypothetical protein